MGALTIVTLAWKYAIKVRKMAGWIEGDHKKVYCNVARSGYNDWDGLERRERTR